MVSLTLLLEWDSIGFRVRVNSRSGESYEEESGAVR